MKTIFFLLSSLLPIPIPALPTLLFGYESFMYIFQTSAYINHVFPGRHHIFFCPIPIQSLFWKTHFKEDPENFMTISILTCPFQHHSKNLSWYLVSFTVVSKILGFNRVFVSSREGEFLSGHQQSTICMASEIQ